jgi:hypothetical protein
MEIIALSGYARTGKDEAARTLVEEYGFIQVAFADKLREMLYQLNPIVNINFSNHGGNTFHVDSVETVLLQDVIDEHGWQGYKETIYGPEIRRLLQRLGTEAGRQTLWDSIWIDAALTGLPDDAKVVVSDARFNNEFDAVRARGGYIWRIERDGVGPANDHISETEAVGYPYFSLTIYNNGTLDEFKQAVSDEYASKRFTEWCY